ncbi:hypothetical protein L0222_03930 [bacterium]|nr:hypothetical protein [bacterium]MCI0605759.1 hypothetical protein [bacterium]
MEFTTSETGIRTSTRSGFRNKSIYIFISLTVFVVSFFKIADLDFWWHLKTGEIIWEKKEFQFTEIYSFSAAGRPYVDHEWLFQVIQYFFYSIGGPAGIILSKCAILATIYLLIARFLLQKKLNPWIVVTLLIVSMAGGHSRFLERPEIFTELFLVGCYLLFHKYLETKNWKYLLGIAPIIIVWSNIHAAVILGIILQGTFLAGVILERILKQYGYPMFYDAGNREIVALFLLILASIILTGLNPNGYGILMVPFELTQIIDSGLLKNQEWQQPPPLRFPFFYLGLFFVFFLFVVNARKIHFTHLLFGAFLGYVSMKYVRNVALFSMFMPLMVWPYLSGLGIRWRAALAALCITALYWLIALSPFEFGTGEASYFPDQIVKFTKEKNLSGNLFNSYAFGGYLIWNVFPERKILIDGRNEVFLPLLHEIVKVRADGRLWRKFLDKYKIEYALLNYFDELEEVTLIDSQNLPIKTYAPFSSTHFPRSRWALVYWDDDGMILVKRKGLNESLVSMEYTSVFPEGVAYQLSLVRGGKVDKDRAIAEILKKLKEDPQCKRAQRMLNEIRTGS